jgi:Holliday junction resolvase RusA-like endonuclease
MKLILPLPPTTNHIYGLTSQRGFARSYITAKGKQFFVDADEAIKKQSKRKTPIDTECEVWMQIYVSRKRDVDGSIKPILDSLQKSGVILNDSLFWGLHVILVKVPKGEERVELEIEGY